MSTKRPLSAKWEYDYVKDQVINNVNSNEYIVLYDNEMDYNFLGCILHKHPNTGEQTVTFFRTSNTNDGKYNYQKIDVLLSDLNKICNYFDSTELAESNTDM